MIDTETKPPSLFEYIDSINSHKIDLMTTEAAEKAFDSFMVRRGLAMSLDTVEPASRMNEMHYLPSYMQYQYLLAVVTKKKRFSKWSKKMAVTDDIKFVANFYGVNFQIAERYCRLMTEYQIQELRDRKATGGAGKQVKLPKAAKR